jgi:hypothetical protein
MYLQVDGVILCGKDGPILIGQRLAEPSKVRDIRARCSSLGSWPAVWHSICTDLTAGVNAR